MKTSTIVCTVLTIIALGLSADVAYGISQGKPINSFSMLLECLGVALFGAVPLFRVARGALGFIRDIFGGFPVDIPDIMPRRKCGDAGTCMQNNIDAIILLTNCEHVSDQHKDVLGDILKGLVLKGGDTNA